ncbi:hypothetical protein SISSUDRAFT_975197, partial [Sistotremastrum suecicum HHB10207 ss-3]
AMSASGLDQLKSLLGLPLRICIADSRVFLGTFASTDREKNIVLTNTEEYRIENDLSISRGRFVGMVMVPWKYIVKIESQ